MLFTIKVLIFCGLVLILSIRNSDISTEAVTCSQSNTMHNVNSERCSRSTECYAIRNNNSCITVTPNTGNSDWYTSASACETTGGRLLWLHDVNITTFTNNHLQSIINSNCTGCSFLWIGLMHSIYQDNKYFWKRTRNETVKQCPGSFTCANCSANINQSECELLGCCYRNNRCTYPGNLTIDMQYEYEYHGRPYHGSYRNDYRHCVGLQKTPTGWLLRTVECTGTSLPRNGYICEYKCGSMWPTPSPRQNISTITAADTGCGKNSTTSVSDLTTPSTGAENCSVLPKIKHCYPIHGRNSCLKLEQNNHSSNWFYSAGACEKNGGRLLWLFNQNVKTFMSVKTKTMIRNACPNCTFLWIGLMQSTFHDDNFFWKRTQKETLEQCQDPPSSVICAVNATRQECDILGCCFNDSGCFYADNVTVDRQHEYHEMNRVNNSSPGYRRCVGLHKPSSSAPWTPSVYDCSENITDIHGYFCEYKCGNDWPVPTPYVTPSFSRTTAASKSTKSTTIQTSTSTKSPNTVLSSTSWKTNSALYPTNVTAASKSSILSHPTSPKATITTTFNSSMASNINNITTNLNMTSGTTAIAGINTTTPTKSTSSKLSSSSLAFSNITTTLNMTSGTSAIAGLSTTTATNSSTSNISSVSPALSSNTVTLKSTSSTPATAAISTSIKSSTLNVSSGSPSLSYITTISKMTSSTPAMAGITTYTYTKSSTSNASSKSQALKTTISISQATTTTVKSSRPLSYVTSPTSTRLFPASTKSSSLFTTTALTRTSSTPTVEHTTTTASKISSTSNASSSLPLFTTTTTLSHAATTNTTPRATSNATAAFALSNTMTFNRTFSTAIALSTSNFNSSSHLYSAAFHKTSTKVSRVTTVTPNATSTQLVPSTPSSFVYSSTNGNIATKQSRNTSLPPETIVVSIPTRTRISQTTKEMLHKNESVSKENFGKTYNEIGVGGKLSTGAIVGISVAAVLVVIVSSIIAIICIRHFTTTRIGTESPSPGISMSQTHEINIAFNTVREPLKGVEIQDSGLNIHTVST